MKIGLYGRVLKEKDIDFVQNLVHVLQQNQVELLIYEPYYKALITHIRFEKKAATFTENCDVKKRIQFLFSIGGDGSILSTLPIIKYAQIPILGINLGRLGFLASAVMDIQKVVDALKNNQYILEKRALLHLDSNKPLFRDTNYALNEFTIHKKEAEALITVHTYVDNEFLASYWADGVILATPTGSTAYSLSCGGPIIYPTAKTFIITPVAPHNLNMRPIVIPDNMKVTFRVEGRSEKFICTLDSRHEFIDDSYIISIRKEDFTVNLIQFEGDDFFNTIRNKLMWGLDSRN